MQKCRVMKMRRRVSSYYLWNCPGLIIGLHQTRRMYKSIFVLYRTSPPHVVSSSYGRRLLVSGFSSSALYVEHLEIFAWGLLDWVTHDFFVRLLLTFLACNLIVTAYLNLTELTEFNCFVFSAALCTSTHVGMYANTLVGHSHVFGKHVCTWWCDVFISHSAKNPIVGDCQTLAIYQAPTNPCAGGNEGVCIYLYISNSAYFLIYMSVCWNCLIVLCWKV